VTDKIERYLGRCESCGAKYVRVARPEGDEARCEDCLYAFVREHWEEIAELLREEGHAVEVHGDEMTLVPRERSH